MASVRTVQILSSITEGSAVVASLPQRLVTACALALPVTGVALVLMNQTPGRERLR